jgi:hypothetical protein
MSKVIAYTFNSRHEALYAADLPGCDKDVKNPATPNSDWGYSPKEEQALQLTPAQWKRFAAYQRDIGRAAFCFPA